MGSKSIQNSDTKSVKLIAMPIALTQPNAVSKMEKKEVLGLILGIYIYFDFLLLQATKLKQKAKDNFSYQRKSIGYHSRLRDHS